MPVVRTPRKNRPLQAGSLARTRSYIAAAERRGARSGFTAESSEASGRVAIIGRKDAR